VQKSGPVIIFQVSSSKFGPRCTLRMLLSYWMVYRSPCAIKNSQRTTRHHAALNCRVFLNYLRPNHVLLNGWHLDFLSKKANFGDDSETYFWLLCKKRPRCALELALGFSKLSRRASEIKNWQRTTRYKIASIYFWTPCINLSPNSVFTDYIYIYIYYIYIYISMNNWY
jgi:hypothetical protein